MGKNEIETFLSHLAVQQNVAASTQSQALNAIVFLYKKVLDMPVDENLEPVRAKRQPRPPVVMSQAEVIRVLGNMQGLHLLMTKLLYGSGLRLMECIRLRVQDLDFERKLIYVRAAKSPEWQYLSPSKKRSKDPRTGTTRRHHVQESGLQKAVKTAVKKAGILKSVGCHTFRHCFATHLLENGVNIRVVQELMGHADVKTTEIYTHVMAKDISVVQSPLDGIG